MNNVKHIKHRPGRKYLYGIPLLNDRPITYSHVMTECFECHQRQKRGFIRYEGLGMVIDPPAPCPICGGGLYRYDHIE